MPTRSAIVFFIALFYLLLNISSALAQVPSPPIGDFQSEIRSSIPTGGFKAVGDFNSDGRLDFVASSTGNAIVICLGNGDGSFQAPVSYVVNDPLGLAVADLNGDGRLDIVVADFNSLGTPFGGGVSVLLGNGDGTFQAAVMYNTGQNPTAVAIGNFNGDAIPDLAVTDNKSGTISILLGKGDGTFDIAGQVAAGVYPFGIAVSDINRDGKDDIIVTNYCDVSPFYGDLPPFCPSGVAFGDSISVLLGNGDGSFQAATAYSAGMEPYLIAVADLNGDGWPDVTVTSSGRVNVFLNKGDGTLLPFVSYPVDAALTSIVVADFNGDGKLDLLTSTFGLCELLGNGDGTFQSAINYFIGSTVYLVQVGDFNGDGRPDIVASVNHSATADAQFLAGTFLNAGGLSRAQTDIVISPSANPALALDPLFRVTASVSSAGQTPTGSVTSYTDGNLTGQGPLDSNGQTGLFVYYPLHPGTHQVSAVYSGDTATAGSESTITLTVIPMPTAISITSDTNPSAIGETVTFDAVPIPLAGLSNVPSGSVYYQDGSTVLGSSPIIRDPHTNFLSAIFQISSLALGTHSVTAFYPGDRDYAPSTSSPLRQVVDNAPFVRTSSSTLSFFNQWVNITSPVQTVTLTNVGSATLIISSITTSSKDFMQNNTCGASLAAQATCSINVNFTPTVPQLESATLLINDNALGSPHTVALSGTGISLGLAISSGSSGTATVSAGQSASYNLSIGGAGVGGMTTITCSMVVPRANCSVPTSVNVNYSTAANFVVVVTTSSRSTALLSPRGLSPTWLWSAIFLGLLVLHRPKRRGAIALGLMLVLLPCGCGGSSSPQPNPAGTPAGTYNLTVVATIGTASQSITLTLVVQ